MHLRTILHPTDLSDAASRALELAVRLAVLHDATLQIFHAVLLHAEDPARTELLLRDYVRAANEHAKRWTRDGHALPTLYYAGNVTSRVQLDPDLPKRVETNLREWAGGGVGDVIVAEGPTALQITQTSGEIGADLIAIGTRGLTGLEHLLVGSVTERVCRFANVPVLTVK